MAEDSTFLSNLEDYPNIHAAYEIFLEYHKAPPENATQLVKWCGKQGIKDIPYAHVNKYLRLRRDKDKELKEGGDDKRKKPVVKSSTERVRMPTIQANVKQFSQRILTQLEDHSKTKTSAELGFDKGQTKSSNFHSYVENFDKVVEEEKKAKEGEWDIIKQQKQQETQKEEETKKKEVIYQKKAQDELKDVLDSELEQQLSSINISNDTEMEYDGEEFETLNENSPKSPQDNESTPQKTTPHLNGNSIPPTTDAPRRKEPWLRLKPYWSEENRRPKDSPETQKLREWLESNKFGQFFDKMYESGVETLDDLRAMQTENDVVELAGPNGINMGVVFRRKFILAVLSLGPLPGSTSLGAQMSPSSPQFGSLDSMSLQDQKKNGVSKAEQQALNNLLITIKDHTTELKNTRDDLANVKQQTEEVRQKLAELFDKAMGVLVVRKKTLENSLNSSESQLADGLKQRTNDLQNSAKTLLKCKQTLEQHFKTTPGGLERQQFVTNAVESALQKCPPNEEGQATITFDHGKVSLIEFLENFGSIGVGRQKDTENATS